MYDNTQDIKLIVKSIAKYPLRYKELKEPFVDYSEITNGNQCITLIALFKDILQYEFSNEMRLEIKRNYKQYYKSIFNAMSKIKIL